ncbi:hypothetical protein [Metabacillus fastidiosus]|uniref:hypothetical protein n=1 Tax=Metabacillus fastidiosus TaxID=1458 RepID=UPI003D2A971C
MKDPVLVENDQNGEDIDNLPGADEDDNILKDNDPDPEDPVEGAEDMGNKDNKGE